MSRSARSASPRAMPWRSSHTLPQIIGADDDRGGRARRRRCSAISSARRCATTTKEAELAKLFTNTWRYMKFAVANQFFMIADQAGVDYTNVLRAIREDYPRARDLPGPGSPPAVPVQGHDAARGIHERPLPDGPGRDAGQRGPTRVHRRCARAPLRRPRGQDRRASSAWRSRPNPTTRAHRSRTSCASSCRGRAPACSCTDPYVDDDRLVSLECVLEESDVLVLGAPHKAYRGLQIGGKDVVDMWGALGEGIRL